MSFGSTSGIRFSGLASGLDTESIVSQLINLERLPIQRLQTQQRGLQQQQAAFTQFKSQLQGLNGSLSTLALPNGFAGTKSTSSDNNIVTVASSATSTPGVFDLVVNRLATTHKVASKGFTNPADDLGLTGTFSVNGKELTLETTDSLTEVAAKINGLKADVTASIINGGEGRAFLSITAKNSGVAGQINLTEPASTGGTLNGSGALAKLGLKDFFKAPITNGFSTGSVADADANLRTAFGLTTGGTATINIAGQDLAVNLDTMSLNDLATAASALTGVDAAVVADGTNFKLNITGESGPIDVVDSSDLLVKLRATEKATTLVTAQDAEYSIDGVSMTSSKNSISDVLPGTILGLVAADPAKTVKISVSNDFSSVVNNVKSLVDGFNSITSFIKNNSQFDADTFESGPLFGNSVAQQLEATLQQTIFSNVNFLEGNLRNLTQVGLSFEQNGTLKLDESVLKTKLEEDPNAVRELFVANGRTTGTGLEYVSGSNKTKASPASGYEVNITQLATHASISAADSQSAANVGGEVLTFSGQLLGTQNYQLAIPAGYDAQQTADLINNDSRLKALVKADLSEGKLKIESLRFGSSSAFSVVSNLEAVSNTSGIGIAGESTFTAGLDIAGTINGEPATGSGQFLLGKAENATTDGLQIKYTGTTTGIVGRTIYTRGISGPMVDSISTFLDSKNGLLTSSSSSVDTQIEGLNDQIARINARAASKERELRARFTAMEQALAASQQQLAQMNAIRGG